MCTWMGHFLPVADPICTHMTAERTETSPCRHPLGTGITCTKFVGMVTAAAHTLGAHA